MISNLLINYSYGLNWLFLPVAILGFTLVIVMSLRLDSGDVSEFFGAVIIVFLTSLPFAWLGYSI